MPSLTKDQSRIVAAFFLIAHLGTAATRLSVDALGLALVDVMVDFIMVGLHKGGLDVWTSALVQAWRI